MMARLVGGVREHEREDRDPITAAGEQGGQADAEQCRDDEEWHPPPRPVGHRVQERRQYEDDAHRHGGDDAVDAVRTIRADALAHPQGEIERPPR